MKAPTSTAALLVLTAASLATSSVASATAFFLGAAAIVATAASPISATIANNKRQLRTGKPAAADTHVEYAADTRVDPSSRSQSRRVLDPAAAEDRELTVCEGDKDTKFTAPNGKTKKICNHLKNKNGSKILQRCGGGTDRQYNKYKDFIGGKKYYSGVLRDVRSGIGSHYRRSRTRTRSTTRRR